MKYKINRNIILQKLDNKLVGFDVERSFLYTFNETAEYIYKKLKSGWEENKIAANLIKKYEVPASTVKKDIRSLIRDMIKNKILLEASTKKSELK